MAFNYVARDAVNIPPFENRLLLTNAEAAVLGEGLVLTSGRLTKVGATATPEWISNRAQAAEATSVTPLSVIRNQPQYLWETTSTGQIPVSAIGSLYTIHTDGAQITTTTTNGVFEVVETDGATLSRVKGYFKLA